MNLKDNNSKKHEFSPIIMNLKIDGHPTSRTNFNDKNCIFIIFFAYYLGVLVKIKKYVRKFLPVI